MVLSQFLAGSRLMLRYRMRRLERAPLLDGPLPDLQAGGLAAAGGPPGEPQTNHPLEYDPVTNEHTAKMTLARTAALELYNAGK